MTKFTFFALLSATAGILILWIWQKAVHEKRPSADGPGVEQILPATGPVQNAEEDSAMRVIIPCIQSKDWTCAESKLRASLENAPGNPVIEQTLGKVFFMEDKFREAAVAFDSASAHGPLDKYATAMYAKAKDLAREDSNLGRIRSAHFELGFENSNTLEKSGALLAALERYYDEECLLWGHYPDKRFTVILYESNAYQGKAGLPDWSAAAFDGRLRIPLSAIRDSAGSGRILRHELAHAFIAEMSGNKVPAWFQEGFAQMIDGTAPDSSERETPPPAEALSRSFSEADAGLAGKLYRHSQTMAMRLYAKAGSYQAIGDFLLAYRERSAQPGAGPSFDSALAERFGISTETLYGAPDR